MTTDLGYFRDKLANVVRGRKVILAGVPVAAATRWVETQRGLGAARCLIVAPTIGTGELPDEADADWVTLGVAAHDTVEEARGFERAVADLPSHVVEAIDRFDPDRSALTYVSPPYQATTVAGRAAYGARRTEWVALEDKATVDALFDLVGIPHPPSVVVPAERHELLAAASRVASRDGSVWSGDSSEGFNGGAVFVRWVRTAEDTDEAVRFLESRCRRVRIAPFVEGIPCSIHGLVVDNGAAVFRPVEMVTLRRPGDNRLCYAGCATFWDPADHDRADMRDLARRLADALRRRVAYRGAFTLDGIMSRHGFVATEVNPRFGAGLSVLAGSLPDLPLLLLHHAAVAREPWDMRPDAVEKLLTIAADRRRGGGGWLTFTEPRDDTQEYHLVGSETGYRPAQTGERAEARLSTGPSAVGGFVGFEPNPEHTPTGRPLAPRVTAAFRAADRWAGTQIGPLSPARDVRAGQHLRSLVPAQAHPERRSRCAPPRSPS